MIPSAQFNDGAINNGSNTKELARTIKTYNTNIYNREKIEKNICHRNHGYRYTMVSPIFSNKLALGIDCFKDRPVVHYEVPVVKNALVDYCT